ncbi:16S rRNA (cytosine(1402)-N(4))-methyltransferase RsmH [Leeia aquatica]|uniref:Ribosomal RNA small subunit methyltransferase H n=1 Tax=Leeia aquatica TaxID=2725557 RepID=A0A847S5E2_9NEIS|nr:16S rRNA (cytosine(1402)-N(4))-methyltransferase RsmH [Leeia aquatica]NLR75054.1 16S rRNA (cytosine(1402)-N(4))-methyltransferase RsmH [Leeia aquatica]
MSTSSPHVTVLLEEAVTALSVHPDGIYVDGTFGRGGHSRRILQQLGPQGRLIALDRDPQAIAAAASIDDPRFTIVHTAFAELADVLAQQGIAQVDGILLDLGVSSPQLDEAERGFSFRFDAPLDMRMDNSRGLTAADWLNSAAEADIARVVRDYGEERFAKQVASAIVAARGQEPIVTTRQLAAIVAKAVRTREPGQDPATRTFQAVRIYLNRELEELSLVLPAAIACLKPGGRLAVISFHSLEDRMVKQTLRDAATVDRLPSRVPVRAADMPQAPVTLIGKAIKPSAEEIRQNPRSRSAVLRVAERTGGERA